MCDEREKKKKKNKQGKEKKEKDSNEHVISVENNILDECRRNYSQLPRI